MTWETDHYTTEAREACQAATARYSELEKQGVGDPFTDLQWCQARVRELAARTRLLAATIDQRARDQRTQAHKSLGKEYGKASERIRRLKGEVAILRHARGRYADPDILGAENERLVAENEELRRLLDQKQQTIKYYYERSRA